jgi:hypothetical protein
MATEYKLSYTATDINRRLEKVDMLVQTINSQTPDENGNIDGLATEEYVNTSAEKTLLAIYPVGAIYLSVNSTSPASLFGGTWERIEDTFLLAAGSSYAAGTTGGEASVTLGKTQVPNVIGDITMHSGGTATNISNVSGCFSSQLTNSSQYRNGGTVGATASSIGIVHFDNGGQGKAHNNMPPYLAVYMWQRVE